MNPWSHPFSLRSPAALLLCGVLGASLCGCSFAAREQTSSSTALVQDEQSTSAAADWLQIAKDHEKARRSELAIEAYEQALALDPSNPEAYLPLYHLYAKDGQYAPANALVSSAEDALSEDELAVFLSGTDFSRRQAWIDTLAQESTTHRWEAFEQEPIPVGDLGWIVRQKQGYGLLQPNGSWLLEPVYASGSLAYSFYQQVDEPRAGVVIMETADASDDRVVIHHDGTIERTIYGAGGISPSASLNADGSISGSDVRPQEFLSASDSANETTPFGTGFYLAGENNRKDDAQYLYFPARSLLIGPYASYQIPCFRATYALEESDTGHIGEMIFSNTLSGVFVVPQEDGSCGIAATSGTRLVGSYARASVLAPDTAIGWNLVEPGFEVLTGSGSGDPEVVYSSSMFGKGSGLCADQVMVYEGSEWLQLPLDRLQQAEDAYAAHQLPENTETQPQSETKELDAIAAVRASFQQLSGLEAVQGVPGSVGHLGWIVQTPTALGWLNPEGRWRLEPGTYSYGNYEVGSMADGQLIGGFLFGQEDPTAPMKLSLDGILKQMSSYYPCTAFPPLVRADGSVFSQSGPSTTEYSTANQKDPSVPHGKGVYTHLESDDQQIYLYFEDREVLYGPYTPDEQMCFQRQFQRDGTGIGIFNAAECYVNSLFYIHEDDGTLSVCSPLTSNKRSGYTRVTFVSPACAIGYHEDGFDVILQDLSIDYSADFEAGSPSCDGSALILDQGTWYLADIRPLQSSES